MLRLLLISGAASLSHAACRHDHDGHCFVQEFFTADGASDTIAFARDDDGRTSVEFHTNGATVEVAGAAISGLDSVALGGRQEGDVRPLACVMPFRAKCKLP